MAYLSYIPPLPHTFMEFRLLCVCVGVYVCTYVSFPQSLSILGSEIRKEPGTHRLSQGDQLASELWGAAVWPLWHSPGSLRDVRDPNSGAHASIEFSCL